MSDSHQQSSAIVHLNVQLDTQRDYTVASPDFALKSDTAMLAECESFSSYSSFEDMGFRQHTHAAGGRHGRHHPVMRM